MSNATLATRNVRLSWHLSANVSHTQHHCAQSTTSQIAPKAADTVSRNLGTLRIISWPCSRTCRYILPKSRHLPHHFLALFKNLQIHSPEISASSASFPGPVQEPADTFSRNLGIFRIISWPCSRTCRYILPKFRHLVHIFGPSSKTLNLRPVTPNMHTLEARFNARQCNNQPTGTRCKPSSRRYANKMKRFSLIVGNGMRPKAAEQTQPTKDLISAEKDTLGEGVV